MKEKGKRGRQTKTWEDNIKEWIGTLPSQLGQLKTGQDGWKGIFANSSLLPRRPSKVMRENKIDPSHDCLLSNLASSLRHHR